MNRRHFIEAVAAATLLQACTSGPVAPVGPEPETPKPLPPVQPKPRPKIGLALGGGAARGFAHVGVIKALETNGIMPDFIAGTSVGAVVGSLYAAGFDAFDLQKLAFQLEESSFTDWAILDRGILKGEALEKFINQQVGNRPIEQLKRKFGAVATDIGTGEMVVFGQGNTGKAVRASASIPGVFSPVMISGHEYVDGGVVSPVPVRAVRQMGAELVIAVDIGNKPSGKQNEGTLELMLDTIAIMQRAIVQHELDQAEIVIQPNVRGMPAANFQQRNAAILEGERAGFAAIARIRDKLAGR